MMKFTTLQHLIETGFDVGLDSYEIFDESYRDTLNNKIIDEYYLREVNGTADAFKFYINRAMTQIMPYYNKLYESDLVKLDPFIKRKLEEIRQKTSTTVLEQDQKNSIDQDQTTSQNLDNATTIINNTDVDTIDSRVNNSSVNQNTDTINNQINTGSKVDAGDDLHINSKTPQSELLAGDISNNLYADEATKNQNSLSSSTEDNSSINENVATDKTEEAITSGVINTGTKSDSTQNSATDNTTVLVNDTISVLENDTTTSLNESESYTKDEYDIAGLDLLEKYKNTLYNIDMMIVMDQKIKDCFMQVYF